jgi:dTDP-4-amino-4,6-dideoxygalactose transaminase
VHQIRLPFIHPKAESIYNQFTLIVENRTELMKYLTEKEIGCAVYYPLSLHLQECFASLGGKKGDCPVSEALSDRVLSIPIYSELSTDQLAYVVQSIKSFFQ